MKALIKIIEERPNYIKHHVLDAGRSIIAVRTKIGYFLFNGTWTKVAEESLKDIFDLYYFKSYYKDFTA